jgi:putative ABC transport system permease protein
MAGLRAWFTRLAGLFDRRRRDVNLSEELNSHLAAHIDDNIRAGMTPDEARRRAQIALGGLVQVSEAYRERRTLPFVEKTMQDIRYALRLLVKSPGYALAAIAALAIGVGANTAVFSVVNGVLVKSFPYRDPSKLVLLFEQIPISTAKFGFSPPDFETMRRVVRSYDGFAAYRTQSYELAGTASPQRVTGARVSYDLFSILGAEPARGRVFTAAEDQQIARVAVVSDGLWARTFGRDPSVVGRSIQLDGRTYTVVGIMPRQFVFPPRGAELNGEPADVFIPMSFLPFERQGYGMFYNSTVIARLKQGVTIDQARAETTSLLPSLIESYPPALRQFVANQRIPVTPFSEETVGNSRRLLLVLMGAVALVLLIGCADVASLILTRSAARQRELAVRSALGATRARLVRQLFTESVVLAAAGSIAGAVLGFGLTRTLVALAGERLPRAESIAFDYSILAFTALLAIVTPLVFGVVPALRAARNTDSDALKESGRHATGGRHRSWLLGGLVVAQFAVALILSVGAGLLVRSFVRLVNTGTGFRPEQSVRATVTLPIGRYANGQPVIAFYQRAIDAARTIPNVAFVGAGSDLPLGVRERRAFSGDGASRPVPEGRRLVAPTWTAGSYFDALGITLKRGRFFTDADAARSQRVVIINDQMARLLWPDADPIGRQLRWGINIPENQSPWMTVVGLVADVKQAGLDIPAMPQVYVPLVQDSTGAPLLRTVNVIVRSTRDAGSLMADARRVLQAVDPSMPVTTQALDEMVGESVKPQRFSMTVMSAFAGVALVLAALGIYGVLANAIAQQTQEIGVRIALGATTGDVIWMVLRRALILSGAGLLIGVAGALALTRTMAGLLFEVRATDALSFAGAAFALAATALVASLLPAWKATRVDPIVALRAE